MRTWMMTSDSNTSINAARRALMVSSVLALGMGGRAKALSPLVALVVPSLLAGALSLLGIRRQLEAEQRIAEHQLAFQRESMLRSERLAVFQTLMAHRSADGSLPVDSQLSLLQGIASDPETARPANRVLSENIDGHGTRIGLVSGCLALERGRHGLPIDNQVAKDLGAGVSGDDALALAVTGIQRDLNARLAGEVVEDAARQWGRSVEEIGESHALAGVRYYSRARQPRGNPDIRAAMFLARDARRTVRYAYG